MDGITSLDRATSTLRERIEHLLQKQEASDKSRRVVIALAGVPGSGKSTVSDALLRVLPKYGIDDAAILPMDGFHHTRATLSTFDDPALAFRKRGAPFTFDADAVIEQVLALKETPLTGCDEPEINIRAPSFDHAVGDPVPDAISISSRCRVVIVEGNYTLLNQEPWKKIAEIVDDRWFVDVSPEVARERLGRRHLKAGIEKTLEAAILRAEDNDLPNGDLVRSKLIEPDVRIVN